MKKQTRNRIEIIILSLIALAGFIYVNSQEAKLDRQIQELRSDYYDYMIE
ncbi:hypothetical protein [Dysgonomonas alginatilytica]|nr:hypothetical protein [Dysgonomonas alginatilytica]